MRKNRGSLLQGTHGTPEPMMEMNMTPLIDVMLVLIIMLIITIPKQNHAINIGLNGTPPAELRAPAVVTIDVDFDGTVLWNGLVVAGKDALAVRFHTLAAATTPTEVHVRPNKFAPYKFVAGVMASAQRSGVMGIGIVGNEQFM